MPLLRGIAQGLAPQEGGRLDQFEPAPLRIPAVCVKEEPAARARDAPASASSASASPAVSEPAASSHAMRATLLALLKSAVELACSAALPVDDAPPPLERSPAPVRPPASAAPAPAPPPRFRGPKIVEIERRPNACLRLPPAYRTPPPPYVFLGDVPEGDECDSDASTDTEPWMQR